MKKLLMLLLAIVGICNCFALYANAAVGSILYLLVWNIDSLFNHVVLGLIFIVSVIIDCIIVKKYVAWRNSILVASIGCNVLTMIIGGHVFMMGYVGLAFGLKYQSFIKTLIVGYIMLSIICAIVTAIDVGIQYLVWKKLFSAKQTDQLMIRLSISGFVLLLGIVTSKILLRW